MDAGMPPISDRYFEDYIEGDVQRFGTIAVEADEIVDFANRFDPETLHTDPEAAKSGPFGGLIASGWHTAGLMTRLFVDHYLTKVASLGSPGGDELRWVKPVRPGDALSVRVTVLKAVPSKSKPDRGAVTSYVEVINQASEVVMTFKVVNIIAKRPMHAERKYDRDFLLSTEKRNQLIERFAHAAVVCIRRAMDPAAPGQDRPPRQCPGHPPIAYDPRQYQAHRQATHHALRKLSPSQEIPRPFVRIVVAQGQDQRALPLSAWQESRDDVRGDKKT